MLNSILQIRRCALLLIFLCLNQSFLNKRKLYILLYIKIPHIDIIIQAFGIRNGSKMSYKLPVSVFRLKYIPRLVCKSNHNTFLIKILQ